MSVINNATNPFLLNIQPITNQPQYASGTDPMAVLRSDVNDIQQMVIFSEKRIAVDVISSYSEPTIQVINNLNIASNNILSINNIPVVPGGTTINNGSGSNIEYLGSNAYGWWFPPSSIGGVGIRDSTGIPRAPPADTYTNAITKIDAYIFENLVDSAPAPNFLAESRSISSINYYWKNPSQFKFNFINQWSPYISSIQFTVFSNVSSNSSNPWFTYLLNDTYTPKGSIPLGGLELMNSLTPGTMILYSNTNVSNYVLQYGIDPMYLSYSNGPYSLAVNFQNYSTQPYKYLLFGSNNLAVLVPRAPTLADFTVTLYDTNTLGVYVVPQLLQDAYLTPNPVYYYSLLGTTDLCNVPGPYNDGANLSVDVVSGRCGYDVYFMFSVIASNSFGTSPAKIVSAYTGPAPFAATPIVSLSGIFNSNTGEPTLSYSASNEDGTLFWRFTSTPGLSGSNEIASNVSLVPTHYFQYYDTSFDFVASNVGFCKQTASSTTSYSCNYFIAPPQLGIVVACNASPYTITVTASNLPFVPAGVTFSNIWTYPDANVYTVITSASNLTCIGCNVNTFTFSSQYTLIDSSAAFRTSAPTSITGYAAATIYTYSSNITYTQSIPVTFPINAINGTCSASATIGYTYIGGPPNPGVTILFQTIPPNTDPGIYTWSFQAF